MPISSSGAFACKPATQNLPRRLLQDLFHNVELVVLLGPRDPEDSAPGQVQQMGEVHISPVKQDDLARAQPGAHGPGVMPVGVPGRVEQEETGQKTLQVQAQMTLGRGLAAAMLGPVQTRGDEFDRGRINDVNGAGEPPGPAAARARPPRAGQRRRKCASICQNKASANAGSRSLLACERPFLLGGVAPRKAESGPEWSRRLSQTSLRLMA